MLRVVMASRALVTSREFDNRSIGVGSTVDIYWFIVAPQFAVTKVTLTMAAVLVRVSQRARRDFVRPLRTSLRSINSAADAARYGSSGATLLN